MQQAKTLMESIQSEIRGALQEAIAAARRVADDLRAQVDAYPDLQRLNKAQQDQVLRPLTSYMSTIGNMTVIAAVRDAAQRLQTETKNAILQEIANLAYPPPEPSGGGEPSPGHEGTEKGCREPEAAYVTQGTITVPFDKLSLESADDVEAYLNAVRKAYLAAIQAGKRITITH